MFSPELEKEILALGQRDELKSLQKLLVNTELEELMVLIRNRIGSGSFIKTWYYILKALSIDSGTDTGLEEKKVQVIVETLKSLDGRSDVSSLQMSSIVNYLSTDLIKFRTNSLVELCDFCIERFQNTSNHQQSCKELFPEIIGILSEKDVVVYNGFDLSGKEFKKQVINTLCMLQWPPENVTIIASMFIDLSLTNDEHQQVVNKSMAHLEKLTIQEIPGFIFQLLKLCQDKNFHIVIMKLQAYFGIRIYEASDAASHASSESMSLDAIEPTSHQDLLEAESTVLFHIHSLASFSSNSVKEYLLQLKNMIRTPEFILHPFQLAVLFTISTIQQYEEKIFEILKSSVSKYYSELSRKEASLWFNGILSKSIDIENNFKQILNLSLQDRDSVLEGLVKFAFILLNIKSGLPLIFIDPIAEKEWSLGILILIKIIGHKTYKGVSYVQEIINNILTDQNVTQYIECLYFLSRKSTFLLLENQSCITDILEDLIQIPGGTAIQILDAIMPLTVVSSTIRDHLILLLRKALYSSKVETRQMAVTGYIKLLTNSKITGGRNLSQLSQSMNPITAGRSLFTQISLNRSSQNSQNTVSNEALCLEILSVLKRCFMQKLGVRNQLYQGLYRAFCQNTEIRIPVLNMLWVHFSQYYIMDEETLPPLDFSKISIIKDIDVIQQESLGKLVNVIGLLLVRKDNSIQIDHKFEDVLESLCDRMTRCELVHFQLDDGTNMGDVLPECQQKVLILQEAMLLYEALIAYKINSSKTGSTNGQQIVSLFQGYNRLLNFAKSNGKIKKGKKKQSNSDESTQLNSTSNKKDQKTAQPLKMPESIFNFETVIRSLQLLLEPDIDWMSIQEASVIKSKREIHRHVLQSTYHLLNSLRGKKVLENVENEKNKKNIIEVAKVIYNRCIKPFNIFIDYDTSSAILAAECFQVALNCMTTTYKKYMLQFLQNIVQKENETLVSCLEQVIKIYQKLFEIDEDIDIDDAEIKKLQFIFISTLTLLSSMIPSSCTALSIEFYDWLKDYAKHKTLRAKPVGTPFFTLLFSVQMRFKKDLILLDEVIKTMGQVIGTPEEIHFDEAEKYMAVNELSVDSAYTCLTNAVNSLLDDIDWVIYRLKSEYIILTNTDDQNRNFRRKESIFAKEKGVCCQLFFVVTVLKNLSSVLIQPGVLAEALFKSINNFYTCITHLTKYFSIRSTKTNPAFEGARFEMLVKFVGRELSPSVNYLILYLEEESKKEQSTQKKGKSLSSLKSKILKDTRFIPKVTYSMEQFSSCIIQISNKSKKDLAKYIGQGTTRDFRIMLKELANTREENDDTVENEDTVENSRDDTSDVEDEDVAIEESPPLKRKKL